MTKETALANVIHHAYLELENIENELVGAIPAQKTLSVQHTISIKDSVVVPLELKRAFKEIVPSLRIKRGELEDSTGKKTHVKRVELLRGKQGNHTILTFIVTLKLIQ